MNKLEEICKNLKKEFIWITSCFIDKDTIIVEEEYEMGEDEKNSDDCCDVARENGEMIIKIHPELVIDYYYCHRNKYAIVNLKLKDKIPRKYILIEPYPGSPKIGSIVTEDSLGQFVSENVTIFSEEDIINYPKNWGKYDR